MTGEHARRRRVVIVGGGFAGFHAARALSRLAKRPGVEVVLVNPTDYFLYLPLLPDVAAGILDPRRVSVPLAATLPSVRLVLGTVEAVDLAARRVALLDPEGRRRTVAYDRLLLATRQRPPADADPRGCRARPRLPRRGRGAAAARPPGAPAGAGGQLRRPGRAGGALHLCGGGCRLYRHRGRRPRPAADPHRRRPAPALAAAGLRFAGAARAGPPPWGRPRSPTSPGPAG